MDPDLQTLARRATEALAALPDPGYRWPFRLREAPTWVPATLATGRTQAQADLLLTTAAQELHAGLDTNDEQRTLDAVRVVMDWGGVWYDRGAISGNKDRVNELARDGLLVSTVRANLRCLANENPDGMTRMNAGWTKVYAVAFDDGRFIMYDSRVSAWFTERVLAEEIAQGRTLRGLRLRLRQTSTLGGERYTPRYSGCAGLPRAWSASMLNASAVVHEVLRLGREDPGFATAWFAGFGSRQLEGRLFMLGQ